MLFSYQCNDEDVKRCESFAKKMTHSKRVWNAQYSIPEERMHNKTVYSKLAEIGAAKYLRHLGKVVTDPDFNIYPSRKKSYSADLKFSDGKGVHVKSQSTETTKWDRTLSWVFMNDEPIVWKQTNDYVLFGTFDCSKNVFNVVKYISANLLQQINAFKPTLRQNNHLKCAVYYNDIKEM